MLVICRTAPLYLSDEDENEYHEVDTRSDTLTADQLAGLDEYFARKFDVEPLSENTKRNIPHPTEDSMHGPIQLRSISRYNECVRKLESRTDLDAIEYASKLRSCHRFLKQLNIKDHFG